MSDSEGTEQKNVRASGSRMTSDSDSSRFPGGLLRNPIVVATVTAAVTGLVVFVACFMVWYHVGGSAWRSWKSVEEAQLIAPDRLSLKVISCEGAPQLSELAETEVDIQVKLYVHFSAIGIRLGGPPAACVAHVEVRLSEPLGNRLVVDMHTGQSVSVSSPTPLPDPTPEPAASIIVDKGLAQVAEQWPGFGGYYLELGTRKPPHWYTAYVYMQNACQHEEAESALKQLVGAERIGVDIFGVYPVEADYSIVQLGQWHEDISGITDPGLVVTDLDESRNRLEIRVVDDAAAQRIEQKLEELSVPRKAVAVRIREPVKLYESPKEPIPPAELKEQLSDALLQDLETIALQKGISLDAAIKRYGSQGSFLALVDTIRETFPGDYAWARVELAASGLVAFAGRPPDAALWMIEGYVNRQWGATVEVHSHVGFNEMEGGDAIRAFHYAASEAPELGVGRSGADVETGHLTTITRVLSGVCDAAVIDDVHASATEALIDATRADILDGITVDLVVIPSDPSQSGQVDGPVLTSPDPVGVFGGVDAPLGGTVVFDEEAGCLYLESSNSERLSPVVWPFGATWQVDPPAVMLQGQVIEPGMSVKGGGYGGGRLEFLSRITGDAVADAARICADHVDTEGIALFNVGSEVDVVP